MMFDFRVGREVQNDPKKYECQTKSKSDLAILTPPPPCKKCLRNIWMALDSVCDSPRNGSQFGHES